MWRIALTTCLTLVLAPICRDANGGDVDDRQSVSKALEFVDAGGAELEKQASCINCHHGPLRAWALHEASRAGMAVDLKTLRETTRDYLELLVARKDEYRGQQWGHSLSTFFLLSEVDPNVDTLAPVAATDLVAIVLAEQTEEGKWNAAQQFFNERRPKKDGNEAQTLWTVLALSNGNPTEAAVAARDKAIQWLEQNEPGTTIDVRALRLLVEHRFGDPDRANRLLSEFLKTQHADGGWGWQPDDPSEAWPVGMALYALASLGEKAPLEEIQKARAFLAKTQLEDGSWHVEGKLTKDPKMASYFGTVWAIIGLCRTMSLQ